ncbi:hypothetical protein BU26DRAFT_572562 [Trematosphaeria pertusa]|uniref:Uncharacterized protein n=1 Tax=Trematosphaeria pertusa TaxID=390896 RepID=A0A6A6HT53_9PLEO|nr:uncharacterized protein BU26DRAFT_572562 [Trematosphaeria pertusa]KAF2240620.1 hypothetical protein BU26DRAFT_572562 [Trematosphaeria pertusa]
MPPLIHRALPSTLPPSSLLELFRRKIGGGRGGGGGGSIGGGGGGGGGDGSGLSEGAIIALVVGLTVGTAVLALLFYWCYKRETDVEKKRRSYI